MMNLRNFEDKIDKDIHQRGLSYYRSRSVFRLRKILEHEFTARVSGTEMYNVFIKLDEKENVLEMNCDCPYDWGNECKHEVAVLYSIREGEREVPEDKSFLEIKKALQNQDKNKLIDILLQLSKQNKLAREEIAYELGLEIEEEDEEYYM
ncbi:MAG: hypothetical protein AAF740_03380 [Bacteroidota bacterium]